MWEIGPALRRDLTHVLLVQANLARGNLREPGLSGVNLSEAQLCWKVSAT